MSGFILQIHHKVRTLKIREAKYLGGQSPRMSEKMIPLVLDEKTQTMPSR